MTQPFKPSPTDIQNLQTIRRAINRTAYHGGLGLKESGKMLGTMDRLLASLGVGPDEHGELEDDDPLKAVQTGTVDKLGVYERMASSLAKPGRHEGDNCRCPTPMTCPYCSRMYPCDCAGCPSKQATEIAKEVDGNILVEVMRAVGIDLVEASEQHAQDKVRATRVCKTCKERPVVTFDKGSWDECALCYSKGYGK